MFLNILWLVMGLALILWGANSLVNGAASVAKKMNVSNLVIGLTIVAFGTSMPEFMVTLLSTIKGSSDLAIGNIIGSNLFNTFLIVGVAALFMPIRIGRGMNSKEIPMNLLSAVVLIACALDVMFSGQSNDMLSRGDGIILLCFFAIFMRYVFASAKNMPLEEESQEGEIKVYKGWKAALLILLGLTALIGGGQLFVTGATSLALAMGVSESIIGLTIVAAGTSLPELATSIVAAIKKNAGIAIGNVVGSNVFNVFWILGCSATIRPMPLGDITYFDLGMLLLSGLLLWVVAKFFSERKITRVEGAVLVLCYVAYIVVLIDKI